MAELLLEGLSKTYPNGVRALRDLTLSVADGELLVLLGPSGCGKTTALRLVAGLETPSAGTISIGGKAVNRLPPDGRDVAMVFQRPALYPHLSVRDNLGFGLWLHTRGGPLRSLAQALLPPGWGLSPAQRRRLEERVTWAARTLGLQDVLDSVPAQLSGGQQQRVALGRAAVREPALFLLDEPLSNLDAPLRSEMRRELHLLRDRLRATMVYVTHDQTEAMTLGDRVAVLATGTLQQVGRPPELYHRPANTFVAGFLGWPPMNLLDGRLVLEEGRLRFRCPAGDWPLGPGAVVPPAPHAPAVTLGLRADDVRLTGPDQDGTPLGETGRPEVLGGTWVTTVRCGDLRLTVQGRGGPLPASGETVPVALDFARAHWFDGASGLALAHPEQGR
jgi:multiple sugar transport system ATP-binding protein